MRVDSAIRTLTEFLSSAGNQSESSKSTDWLTPEEASDRPSGAAGSLEADSWAGCRDIGCWDIGCPDTVRSGTREHLGFVREPRVHAGSSGSLRSTPRTGGGASSEASGRA